MRMLASLIEVKVVDELVTKTVLWKHALDGHPYEFGRLLCQDLLRSGESLTTWITSMADIHPVGHLLASESHLVSIEDDNVITAILVRGEIRLVLTAEDEGNP